MKCNLCGAEVEEGKVLCPACEEAVSGAETTEETAPQEAVGVEEAPVAEAAEPEAAEPEAETVEAPQEETAEPAGEDTAPVQKPVKMWKIVVAVLAGAVLLAALIVGVLYGLGFRYTPRENDIYYKTSYTVEDSELIRQSKKNVATVGGEKLTNSKLQAYYWLGFSDLLSANAYYYTSYGLDYSAPLDGQLLPDESGMTWEQFFLENALNVWKINAQMALLATEEGFELDAESAASLAELPQKLEEMAQTNGAENAEAMLKKEIGACCTVADYVDYVEERILAESFYAEKYQTFLPTDEESQAYFTANEQTFAQSGITVDSGNVVSVRHILLQPADGVTDENNTTTYSEEAWAACQQEAEALLQQWLENEPTEESFAELANTHSVDGGSNTNGGLYTGVTQGQMVEAFDAWIMDENRQIGDYGIVQTEFGYHLMFFVSGEPVWLNNARSSLLSERISEFMAELDEKWPIEVDYRKIVLGTSGMISTEE